MRLDPGPGIMIKTVQALLGIHGLLGAGIFVWAVRVLHGSQDFLTRTNPGIGVLAVSLGWILAGWVIARSRPVPPRGAQPEARFAVIPSVVIGVAQLFAAGYLLMCFSPVDFMLGAIFMGDWICLVGGPLCAISWAAAGIRFHVGTWALAWSVSIVGFFAQGLVLTQRFALA